MFVLNPDKAVAIDFDGVLHPYSKGWNGGRITDDPFPGIRDFIVGSKSRGYQIIIFTARFHDTRKEELGFDMMEEITSWLDKHDIPYDHITGLKPTASCFVDDRSVHFIPGEWERMDRQIDRMMKYHGREPIKEI